MKEGGEQAGEKLGYTGGRRIMRWERGRKGRARKASLCVPHPATVPHWTHGRATPCPV